MNVEFTTGPEGQDHIYTVAGREVPCVSDVVDIVCGAAADQGGFVVAEEVMDAAAGDGTIIHEALALADDDDLDWDSVDPEIAGYCEAWEDWVLATGFIPDVIEEPVYSEEMDLAGTPDVRGWIGKDYSIVDRKTGSGGIQWRHSVQMTGYRLIVPTKVDRLVIVQLVPKQKRKKWREKDVPMGEWEELLFRAGRDILTGRLINGK